MDIKTINMDIEEEFNSLFIIIKYFLERIYNIPDATFHYVPSKLGNQVCRQIIIFNILILYFIYYSVHNQNIICIICILN